MRFNGFALLGIALVASASTCKADNIPPAAFGALSAYNLVALGYTNSHGVYVPGTISGTRPDVTGRMAAADTINAGSNSNQGVSVGSNLNGDPYGSSSTYLVVAAKGITGSSPFYLNGAGNVYAPTTTAALDFNNGGHLEPHAGDGATSGLNFNTLRDQIDLQTAYVGTLQNSAAVTVTSPNSNPPARDINGNILSNQNWLVLKGGTGSATCVCTYIFNITAAQFGSPNQIDIEIPDGATAIINVSGTNPSLGAPIRHNGQQPSGLDTFDQHILFNFPNASTVTFNNEISASVLAPFALVTGTSQLDGNIIAGQIGSTGEVHNVEFTGTLPPMPPNTPAVPEPGTFALLGTGLLTLAATFKKRHAAL